MRPIQIIGLIIGLYLLYMSYRVFKQEKEDIDSLLLWLLLGGAITIVSINLDFLDVVSTLLQMEKNPFAIFTISILLLFVITFKLHSRNNKLEEQISRLNEELSLKQYEREKKGD